MPMPRIDQANRRKPLSYDPTRRKFIYYDDIVSGREKIVPIESLSEEDLKKLVLERLRAGPEFKGGPVSAPHFSREDVIRAIRQDEPFGRDHLEGEKLYLQESLTEIERNLK
jgi:hypothetical protein